MYTVLYAYNGTEKQAFKADDFKQALIYAKVLSKSKHFVEIKRATDETVCWASTDSPSMSRYTEMNTEQWLNLTEGFIERSDLPSIYFDIDGTLGYWYQDARGMIYPAEVLDPRTHYFRNIEPHRFMIELAGNLADKGYDVCVISAADHNNIRDKVEWLHEHCPFISDENIFFCPLGADKNRFVKGNAHISILIDDYSRNLHEWTGIPVKAINSINSVDSQMLCIDGYRAETDGRLWSSAMNAAMRDVSQLLGDNLIEQERGSGRKHSFERE